MVEHRLAAIMSAFKFEKGHIIFKEERVREGNEGEHICQAVKCKEDGEPLSGTVCRAPGEDSSPDITKLRHQLCKIYSCRPNCY